MNILYDLFGYVMRFCCNISANNYILAVFFFSLIVEILLFPLGIKQQKNSVKTASLRPKEQAIRKKYAGRTDKATQQKMSLEINEMYQKEGYNPMSGCLPLFIQLPVIMILYAIVRLPLTYSTKIDATARAELVDQSVIVGDSQKKVLSALGKGDKDEDYKKATQLINAAKIGSESELVQSLKYTSEPFIKEYIGGSYAEFASKNYSAYLNVSKNFGEYLSFYAPMSTADGKLTEVKKEEIKLDTLKTANTLDMYSFTETASLTNNSVENKLGYGRIERAYDINLEEDIPNFKFIAGTTLLDIPDISKLSPILLIPVLVFVSSFLGAEITRKFSAPAPAAADGQNPANSPLMRFGMPMISVVFTFSFFAALGIYWVYRSVLSAIKQIILVKMYPLPKFSKEEIKAAEEEVLKKRKRKKIIMIEVDEDDSSYDSLIVSEEKAEKIRKRYEKSAEEANVNKNTEKKFIDKAPLKKDKDDSEVN
ncbi:MAG: membrane protein insertase YidC [Ruminococcaceae bacterium]|nr:membrane protein insertase YidC [Oscillospiraceae bacterium]